MILRKHEGLYILTLESVDNHATSANRGNLDAVQGARDAVWSFQTRSEQRRNAPDSPRFRRIAARWSVCRVVELAKGAAISCALRLAFISIGRATHLAG